MRFTVLTLFPDQVTDFLSKSIIGRALEKGIIHINAVDIRDFAVNSYGKVDDTLYGGGTGMLMQCDPVYDAYEYAVKNFHEGNKPYTIYVSPKGNVFSQSIAKKYSTYEDILIICGHYEGIDSRVIDEICDEELSIGDYVLTGGEIVDEEISIGDYVLTGGEIAAVVIVDSVSRMIEGVLPNEDAYTNESHMNGLLEAPQYTKPEVWHGVSVPEVLLSGNKAEIESYNYAASVLETAERRPDLFRKTEFSSEDIEKVLAIKRHK